MSDCLYETEQEINKLIKSAANIEREILRV